MLLMILNRRTRRGAAATQTALINTGIWVPPPRPIRTMYKDAVSWLMPCAIMVFSGRRHLSGMVAHPVFIVIRTEAIPVHIACFHVSAYHKWHCQVLTRAIVRRIKNRSIPQIDQLFAVKASIAFHFRPSAADSRYRDQ